MAQPDVLVLSVHHISTTQMLNFYTDNIMHYTYLTWNFHAIILMSLRYNYTTYVLQAVKLQSRACSYTSYNLQAITFQSVCDTQPIINKH